MSVSEPTMFVTGRDLSHHSRSKDFSPKSTCGRKPVGAPNSPPKRRKASRVSMFGANAQPTFEMTNSSRFILMMGFQPNISDSGAKKSGPIAKPRRKKDMPDVEASWEVW